jgi:hypothetical protein
MNTLYHWPWSQALSNYGPGGIIVLAHSQDEARTKVRKYAIDWLKEYHSWWFDEEGHLESYSHEDYNEWVNKLEKDLEAEPVTPDHPIFIKGSE